MQNHKPVYLSRNTNWCIGKDSGHGMPVNKNGFHFVLSDRHGTAFLPIYGSVCCTGSSRRRRGGDGVDRSKGLRFVTSILC